MGMFFNNGLIASDTYEDNFSRSLRIEGQVAVADLEFSFSLIDRDKPVTIQARLDFSGVSDMQMLFWAASTKITGIHRAIRDCSEKFFYDLFKQGPVSFPASSVESMFIDPNIAGKPSYDRPKKLAHSGHEYFLCLSGIEDQVAVIDLVVLSVHGESIGYNFYKEGTEYDTINSQIHLDFSGVSDTERLLWAARTKMIDIQRAIYRCGKDDKQFLDDLVKQGKPVCRHASEAGNPFDDATKKQQHVMTTAKDMSAEERAALIKLLQQMDK